MSVTPAKFLSDSSVREWLNDENTRHGFRARPDNPLATYTEFPEQYRPGAPSYQLPLFEIPHQACRIFRSIHPDPSLEKRYFDGGKAFFPVHPVNLDDESVPHIKEITAFPRHEITVRPTSSTRTLFVEDSSLPPHCLKPHTNKQITRWRRHMEDRKVRHAVAVTRILEGCPVFTRDSKVGFFPESLGGVYGEEFSEKNWGFIIREMQAQPHLERPYRMIPLNALYIPSSQAPGEEPLLVDMIRKSPKSPRDFILEEIIQPLISGWIEIYLETGILLEPHGQNVIVEMDAESGGILRFSHRDFDCEINQGILESKGYSIEDLNPRDLFTTKGDDWAPQGSHLSIIFDNSMQVALEGLAEVGAKYFGIDAESIKEGCRDFLSEKFPDFLRDHFPQNGKAYNFHKEEDGVSIKEKAQPSRWRSIPQTSSFSWGNMAITGGIIASIAYMFYRRYSSQSTNISRVYMTSIQDLRKS